MIQCGHVTISSRVFVILTGALSIFFLVAIRSASAATYTVNSTVDADDGACVHPFVNAATDCTLEEAIDAANANAGADTITFSIDASFADDGDGQWTLSYAAALPEITDVVELTAVSVWDTDDSRPGIKLSSSQTTGNFLVIGAGSDNSELKGLEVVSGSVTVRVTGASVSVGTDCDGTSDSTERNVIYNTGGASAPADLQFSTGANNFRARGNYIGVRADGVTAGGASNFGVHVIGSPTGGIIGYVEGTSGTCSAATQRNIIANVGKSGFGSAVDIQDSASTIRVSGNYIGLGSNGTTAIGGIESDGVSVSESAATVFIGTDGDGTDDALEGNVIGGVQGNGVILLDDVTDVRVSGNTIGFQANGTTASTVGGRGIVARSAQAIIGWCDATVDADICSNGGTLATQANTVGHCTLDGMFIGSDVVTLFVYGNYIGTNSAGTADYGCDSDGIEFAQSDAASAPTYTIGGASSNQANIIKFHGGHGVYLNGVSHGSGRKPLEGYTIRNNTISNNGGSGVYAYGTDFYGTEGPTDGTIRDNTIQNNSTDGVRVEGSSPLIQDNTISSNTAYGVRVLTMFEPTVGSYTNPYGTLSPQNADRDRISEPNITGNTMNSNTAGGIYILDGRPTTSGTTLAGNNTIGTNGTFDVRQDWYAAVELVDDGVTISAGDVNVVLTPTNSVTCTSSCSGTAHGALSATQGVWGPAGISYDNATTWFTVTDYIVGSDGTLSNYNPYSIEVLGTYIAEKNVVSYTFDGDDSNDASTVQLPTGYDTGANNLHRYQMAEINVLPRAGVSAPSATTAPVMPAPITPSPMTLPDALGESLRDIGDIVRGLIDALPVGGGLLGDQETKELRTISRSPSLLGREEFVESPTSLDESHGVSVKAAKESVQGFYIRIRAYRIERGWSPEALIHVGTPVSAFFFVLGIGAWHTARIERRFGVMGRAHRVHAMYFGAAGTIAVLLFAVISITDARLGVFASEEPEMLTAGSVLRAGDAVRFEYEIENSGRELDELFFHHAFLSGMRPIGVSATEYLNGEFVNLKHICAPDACTTSLGVSKPGDVHTLDLDVQVQNATEAVSRVMLYRRGESDRQTLSSQLVTFLMEGDDEVTIRFGAE